MRVQLVDGEYRVVLPAEAMEALQLREGGEVQVLPVNGAGKSRYIDADEAMQIYLETEPIHRESYLELAK